MLALCKCQRPAVTNDQGSATLPIGATHTLLASDMKSLTIGGQTIAMTALTGGGVLNERNALMGVRHYVAAKAGIPLPKVAKGEKGLTFKEVKALALAKGITEAQLKVWGTEYDAGRSGYYGVSNQLAALAAADPNMRSEFRPTFAKDGTFTGGNAKFRIEKRSGSRVDALLAKIASLEARLATPALVA